MQQNDHYQFDTCSEAENFIKQIFLLKMIKNKLKKYHIMLEVSILSLILI